MRRLAIGDVDYPARWNRSRPASDIGDAGRLLRVGEQTTRGDSVETLRSRASAGG
jgi:hypothetical protein